VEFGLINCLMQKPVKDKLICKVLLINFEGEEKENILEVLVEQDIDLIYDDL